VLDAVGAASAHVIGHSMGGWTAVGLARTIPSRLLSVTLGGWEPVNGIASGLPSGVKGPVLPFERVLGLARATAPDLVSWITPPSEPGLRASWEALDDLEGAESALVGCGSPVLCWSGRDDPRGIPMQALADRHGWEMVWTQGDHLSVVMSRGRESATAIRQAIEAL
jgi:pimeloyl-ACP methyl ester carboxylesterase